ncbi:hypothetical protein [Larkinella humicola]|uniref:Uncharacterized protein n=1 Tax=Larkinella humicola TaxID=2607654 RepID=A0A5N1JRK8_9BACT|nr:hypothetical protein [Larkinella humicola]KAA9357269.1 hypothetical protein F0P93_05905 [Larkinella humicola]
MSDLRETITYRHYYTPEEHSEKSQQLATVNIQKVELEDEKKAITSEYKAKIDAHQSQLNLLSRQVHDRFETRTILAVKRKNFTDRIWEYINPDSGEIIKTEPLTGRDLQYDVPLSDEELPGATSQDDSPIEGEDLENGVEPDATEYLPALLPGQPEDPPKLLGTGEERDDAGTGTADLPGPKKRRPKPKKP